MSDTVKLIVTLSKGQYEDLKNIQCGSIGSRMIVNAVMNGTPLPKGHGRLIDESKITKCEQIGLVIKSDNVTHCLITDAPTIIEADNKSEEA